MNKNRIPIMGAALIILLLTSCSGSYVPDDDTQVDEDLHGIWDRTESVYWPEGQNKTSAIGRLILDADADTVTIKDPIAHLQGFTRNTALEAYTEDIGSVDDAQIYLLYIKDKGKWQNPVRCKRWDAGRLNPAKMLTLEGNEVGDETLKLR